MVVQRKRPKKKPQQPSNRGTKIVSSSAVADHREIAIVIATITQITGSNKITTAIRVITLILLIRIKIILDKLLLITIKKKVIPHRDKKHLRSRVEIEINETITAGETISRQSLQRIRILKQIPWKKQLKLHLLAAKINP